MDDEHEQSKTWHHEHVHEEPAEGGMERERGGERDYNLTKAGDSYLRLSVKSFFYFNDIHCAIEHRIPIVVPLL